MSNPQQVARKLGALRGQRATIQTNLTGSGLHQPSQQAQQTGFTTAIGACHLKHFTGNQTQLHTLEEHAPVSLTGERNGFKKRAGQGIGT